MPLQDYAPSYAHFAATCSDFFRQQQEAICTGLHALDGLKGFTTDHWERPGGGGGRSCLLTGGDLIEKGGVNYACVHGEAGEAFQHFFPPLPPDLSASSATATKHFYATGLSIVLHPRNPHVPIIHLNVRCFVCRMGEHTQGWLGGGDGPYAALCG